MLYDRRTRRTTVLKDGNRKVNLQQYLEDVAKGLPVITIDDKPVKHMRGLEACVLMAKSWKDLPSKINTYVDNMYKLAEKLNKVKEEKVKVETNEEGEVTSPIEGLNIPKSTPICQD